MDWAAAERGCRGVLRSGEKIRPWVCSARCSRLALMSDVLVGNDFGGCNGCAWGCLETDESVKTACRRAVPCCAGAVVI